MVAQFKYNSLIQVFSFCLIVFGFASCNIPGKAKLASDNQSLYSYDFQHPETMYQLPAELKEISGIAYFKQDRIACIQDEKAFIYIFDTKKRVLLSKIDFGSKGDYEDLAIVKDDAYILRSDGNLFKVSDFETNHKKTRRIKTPLGAKNNAEGLFYDSISQGLLIACKDSPSLKNGKSYAGYKAIYRFDLETNLLEEEPAYLIDFSKIDSTKTKGIIEGFFVETAVKLKLTDGSKFYPSALAIHPINRESIYLLSSVGKLLIVMNRQGQITNIVELDPKLFHQPEGICFTKNGDLYISNEGKKGGGNILKFTPSLNSLKKN